MAQTKTKSRSSAKRSGGSKKTAARSRSSASKAKAKKSDAAKAAGKASDAVGNAAGKATDAAGKAKVPLIAGGAALVGAAGGMALGTRRTRRGRHGLAKAAKGAGELSVRVGHLATELQRNREAANGGSPHRSPVEVVLEGLTARRR
jgi:hypothetical protein